MIKDMINIPGSTENLKSKSFGTYMPNLSTNTIISKMCFFLKVLKPKNYLTYHQIQQTVILGSAHTVHLCVVYGSPKQTPIISLYSINMLVFISQAQTVYCAVRAGSSNKRDTLSSLKGKYKCLNRR